MFEVIRFPSTNGNMHGNLLLIKIEKVLNQSKQHPRSVKQRKNWGTAPEPNDEGVAGTKFEKLNILNNLNIYEIWC